MGGTFSKNGDTILNGITYYNNGSWLPLGNGMLTAPQCPTYVSDIIEFNGELYISGPGGTNERHGIVKWNGSTFDTLGIGIKETVEKMHVFDNKLYVFGSFSEAGSLPCSGVAMWDGINWSTLDAEIQVNFPPVQVTNGTFYNNELYVCGNFVGIGGLNKMAKWDGQNWQPVGNGFVGGLASVADLEVYNGELYASGSFTYDDGTNPDNYIARWDGVQWHNVGGGTMGFGGSNGQTGEMVIFNNKLYVSGVFSYAGGIDARYIATWDGQEWCGLGSTFDNVIRQVKVHNNELYISGGFKTIDGDSIVKIAKWTGGDYVDTCGAIIGVEEINVNDEFKIYPNPATNILTLQTNAPDKADYAIYDISGRLMQSGSFVLSKTLDVAGFAEGVYFIRVETESGVLSKKFVKQNE